MKNLFFVGSMLLAIGGWSQAGWTWTELPDMPEPVANNAVVEAMSNDTLCIYSFTGIDSTKEPSGIHLKSWKYNTVSQIWSALPAVPDENGGKIAAGASVVDNIIYLIGGYHVADNFSETSSEKVHRFDPKTDTWLEDGSPIPEPIDDHVQAVWNDSWIYVVTGWSTNGNVNDVQIYNPNVDFWQAGTPTPNGVNYEAFGTSGSIIGDTIYYFGGVQGSFSFTSNARLRKGVIDATDPTVITWSLLDDAPGADGYRAAAAHYGDRLFWIGGAGVAYNFDGIAYNGTGGVSPEPRIATYYAGGSVWEEGITAPYGVMDLRGIGQVSPTSWIICGGMEEDQLVSDRTFLLEYDPSVGIAGQVHEFQFEVVKNELRIRTTGTPLTSVAAYDLNGMLIAEERAEGGVENAFDLGEKSHRLIIVALLFDDGTIEHIKLGH